jgi:hypothetical protein
MYIVRFSYAVLPVNRRKAIGYIHREIEAAGRSSLKSRLLVPITRAPGAASLQFEVELKSLDQLEDFRSQGIGSKGATAKWMQAFSTILLSAPAVEILRVEAS